jgi:CBS domain-containing protein
MEVICPSCGHDNIPGVDQCDECGQSLTGEYQVGKKDAYTDILAQPLAVLKPREPICVAPDTSLAEVIARLKGRNVGCVLVTGERGELLGIFTERDVLYRVAGLIDDLESIVVESLMTRRPTALKPSMAISHALHLMGLHGFRHVPLVDEAERPVGFISFRDIVRFIEKNFAAAA